MSATKEVFSALPILLRSTTPVVSEKVLIWHQKMQEEEPLPPERDQDQSEPDTTPPDHSSWHPAPPGNHRVHTHAPVPRSESSPNSAKILEDLAASKSGVDYAGVAEVDEIKSIIQEMSQAQSRRSSIHPVKGANEPQPTPSRAPKHLSQDTVLSFGNLDASAFEPLATAPVNLQTPKIDIEAPSDSSYRQTKPHSRAPSRISHASRTRVESVPDEDGDNDTVKDDARTVPVETIAASHKSRSVVSHPPDHEALLSPPGTKPKHPASAISAQQSVKSQARGGGSVHPSQMRLPSSTAGSILEATPTQKSIPLNHAVSHHITSHPPSQHAPSKAPTVTSARAPSAREPAHSHHASSTRGRAPSQQHPSANGVDLPSAEKKKTSLHPLSNYPGIAGSFQGSHYAVSKYAGSVHGETSRPLHPLTQHLQMRGPGSLHSYSRAPPMEAQYPDEYVQAIHGQMAMSPTPSNPQGLPPPPVTSAFAYQNNHHYVPEYAMNRSADRPVTPEPYEPMSEEENRLIEAALMATPRTSHTVTPSALAAEVTRSHFHDEDICVLLHAADQSEHDLVRKVIRKAIRNRMRKLQMKHENEKLLQYGSPSGNYHHQVVQETQSIQDAQEPPTWAKDLMMIMQETRSRLDELEGRKKSGRSYAQTESVGEGTVRPSRSRRGGASAANELEDASPITITLPAQTPANRAGTVVEESVLQPGATEFTRPESVQDEMIMASGHHRDGSMQPDEEMLENFAQYETERFRESQRHDSPGQQVLEEEIYKLRVKPARSEHSHRTWEIQQDDEPGHRPLLAESEAMPEIPDTEGTTSEVPHYEVDRKPSPSLPPITVDNRDSGAQGYGGGADWPGSDPPSPPPWQRIHQRLLSWAIVWPMSEFDKALNSTMRGHQVDEVALSIWSTQTYKRYVRARLTEHPAMRVDRLFIPPNVADAINNAVYNGRHGDACGMLRDMWTPFGLDGMPRLLLVLCRHRREDNHWVAHRFSLPDGTLTTYDTYPEKSLPDGRPLGWWFAIRIAWPHAMYPSPDHLAQRMVRIHRPMQLGVDNSLATAGIWRNLLMGSKAERSIDLERLRDLINQEVKNLRQRKDMGKLSITAPRPNWEDMP